MDIILLPSMETSAVNERRHSPPAQSRRASVLDERTSDGTQRKKLGAELLSRLDAYVVMSPVQREEHQGHGCACMLSYDLTQVAVVVFHQSGWHPNRLLQMVSGQYKFDSLVVTFRVPDS